MNTFNLDVPHTSLVVESREVSVSINVDAIPHDVLRQVILHGIKQKISDAASNAAGLVWKDVKGDDAPKPSRDQLADFVAANKVSVQAQTIALMQKAADAMLAGQWAIREASGAVTTRWTEEQSLAIDMAKATLVARFTSALPKGAKAIAVNFVALSPKVAQFFKLDGKRPTWDDKALMAFVAKQMEAGTRDYMSEARDEMARREAANGALDSTDLDDLLADL